jgi:hypothetical protein
MTYRSKIIVTAALILVLGGIAAADVYLSEDDILGGLPLPQDGIQNQVPPLGQTGTGVGVARRQAANVNDVLIALGYSVQPSDESSIISQVVDETVTVNVLKILKDDLVGTVIWIDTPDSKNFFLSLKDALLAAFSPQVKDLSDETKVDPGKPVRNVLTFLDPTLSEERLTFVRMSDRLMEFHTVSGKETEMQTVIDALSTL